MSPTTDALTVAADAENAAIFTYGTITAFAPAARQKTVAEYTTEHRARRNALDQALRVANTPVPQPAAGYTLPVTVTSPTTAAQAAQAAEIDCATAYRALIEQGDSEAVRRLGLDGLTDCARREATWRAALGLAPTTVAFPGAPR